MNIELIRLSTQEYPISIEQFRLEHPHTHLPDDLEILKQIDLSDFDYSVIIENEKPEFNTLTQTLESEIVNENSSYVKKWKIVNLPDDAAASALAILKYELIKKIDLYKIKTLLKIMKRQKRLGIDRQEEKDVMLFLGLILKCF